jgi:methylenetetrahydrofolate--tRNA-(uracil-5-)-methyltransferase
LYRYLREADPAHFQPMNANFGLVDELPEPVRDKKRKREMIAERALLAMGEWAAPLAAAESGKQNVAVVAG